MTATHKNKDTLDFTSILASAVHDMKNSLSMLLNSLEEVAEFCQPTTPDDVGKLAQLQYEGKRLNGQLVQLLTLYKIGKSQYLLNLDEHDVADFLQEATLHHRELFKLREVALTVEAPAGLSWFFDRNLVHGVLNNVLNNAYKYTRDRVAVTAHVEQGMLALRVCDNGEGYPESMLQRENDHQKTGVSFNSGSTGLGLYFSQQVATLHQHKGQQGQITLDNGGIDGGGRFTILLP